MTRHAEGPHAKDPHARAPEGGGARLRALATNAGGTGHRLLDHVGVAPGEDDRRALNKNSRFARWVAQPLPP